ncbi:TRAP transporter small permease [Oceanibium sediminis]|uniref:TRAP transporter small permease n=1 Tax=Oceanibium sediminis TaxID=2026339 RepID=UPI000DD3D90F|nr:TRAP transporter small permease subunit [Oceanibium sediminis]
MMILWGPLRLLTAINSTLLSIGRFLAWVALALMVLAILAQVFFRYVLGDALNWSEELARFLMLWMTGLIAPSAYRWGGFVSIDMLPQALSHVTGTILNLVLLSVAMVVLVVGVSLGYSEVTGFAGKFASPSLKVPLSLVGGADIKVLKAYMMASLLVCMVLMFMVNIELMLRALIGLLDPDADLPRDPAMIAAGSD